MIIQTDKVKEMCLTPAIIRNAARFQRTRTFAVVDLYEIQSCLGKGEIFLDNSQNQPPIRKI